MAAILVVDDESDVANLIQVALTRVGHEVVVASDVESALGRLAERPFDLVVSDLRMPGSEGSRPFRVRAEEARSGLRWLIVSGYVGPRDAAALESGPRIAGVLRKPFDIRALREMVRKILEGETSPIASEGS
jgi:DNA-binding NtrC family response regulator